MLFTDDSSRCPLHRFVYNDVTSLLDTDTLHIAAAETKMRHKLFRLRRITDQSSMEIVDIVYDMGQHELRMGRSGGRAPGRYDIQAVEKYQRKSVF